MLSNFSISNKNELFFIVSEHKNKTYMIWNDQGEAEDHKIKFLVLLQELSDLFHLSMVQMMLLETKS